MTKLFGATSTADDVLEGIDLHARMLVTGVSARIGVETARALAVIANAGVMATPFGHTADGFETLDGPA